VVQCCTEVPPDLAFSGVELGALVEILRNADFDDGARFVPATDDGTYETPLEFYKFFPSVRPSVPSPCTPSRTDRRFRFVNNFSRSKIRTARARARASIYDAILGGSRWRSWEDRVGDPPGIALAIPRGSRDVGAAVQRMVVVGAAELV